MPQDSLKTRFTYKLFTNLIGLPISFVLQALIPRLLGPANFGNFNFLTDFFTKIFSLFDSGTSYGFYTKLSQRPGEKKLITFYWQFAILVFFILLGIIIIAFGFNLNTFLWPKQITLFVFLAFIWSFLSWFSQIAQKIVDAYALTKYGEIARLTNRIFSLALLLILFFFGIQSLNIYFYYQYIVFIALIAVWWLICKKFEAPFFPIQAFKREDYKQYVSEFYYYSSPLFVYLIINIFVGVVDRWLIQYFYGSTEQGYFSLAYQIGAVCFLFTGAMTPLFIRDFSIAFAEGHKKKMQYLFLKNLPLFFTLASCFSVFISVNSKFVINIFGGKDYSNAYMAVTLMSLYPIHQTYGQLSDSVFYATGKTKIYSKVGIFVSLLGLPLSYFIIAPSSKFGLGLGAAGLSIRLLILQFFATTIYLWINCKFLKISFNKLMKHQLIIITCFFLFALLSNIIVDFIIIPDIFKFILTGIIYLTLSFFLIFLNPKLISMRRNQIIKLLTLLYSKICSKKKV